MTKGPCPPPLSLCPSLGRRRTAGVPRLAPEAHAKNSCPPPPFVLVPLLGPQVYQDLCLKHPTFRERSENVDLSVEVSLQPWHAFQPDGVSAWVQTVFSERTLRACLPTRWCKLVSFVQSVTAAMACLPTRRGKHMSSESLFRMKQTEGGTREQSICSD